MEAARRGPACEIAMGLLATIAACSSPGSAEATATVAAPITNGAPDSGDPSVVAIVQNGGINCSGTLIAPSVVLTAAHCLYGQSPAALEVVLGPSLAHSSATIAADALRIDPGFDPVTMVADIGLVHLSSPATAPPATVFPGPLDPSFVGRTVRIVGFGRTSAGDAAPPSKHQGTSTVASVDSQAFTFGPSPSLTCFGDSGGPAFLTVGGTEYLVGVTSAGDPQCDTLSTDTRVDVFVGVFIAPNVAASTTAVGAACWLGDNCASGDCFSPSDAPDFSYCTAACSPAAGCPAGMTCVTTTTGSECQWPQPSPGALGGRCSADVDCESQLCDTGAGLCSRLCFQGSDPCPSGFTCLQTLDADAPGSCVPEQAAADAGVDSSPPSPSAAGTARCSAGAARPLRGEGTAPTMLLMAALWIARLRRSRLPDCPAMSGASPKPSA
jgi:hypothetical protein